jgi:hypothetical protein
MKMLNFNDRRHDLHPKAETAKTRKTELFWAIRSSKISSIYCLGVMLSRELCGLPIVIAGNPSLKSFLTAEQTYLDQA